MFEEIYMSYYATPSIAQGVDFYSRLTGASPAFVDDTRWAQFKLGGIRFALGSGPEVPQEHAGGAITVFRVSDMVLARRRIEEAGGAVLSERSMGSHGLSATARDPFGNIFQVIKL